MALKKDITLDNGIVLNYHRVVSVNNITNQTSIIEVASYINEEQRQKEKEWYEKTNLEKRNGMNVFIETNFYTTNYDKELGVDNSYEFLKKIPIFEGSEDI